MNKDKMELEEAIKYLKLLKNPFDLCNRLKYSKAIETVLQALKTSISKKKIEELVLHLRLLKRHIALNDEQRKGFDVCIKEVQKLLEEK